MWEKNEITWRKVLHAHWRKNTIEIEWIGIINYYFYWTISEAQTRMLAWLLKRERRPSLNQRPRSVPLVAQKTWTTKSSFPKHPVHHIGFQSLATSFRWNIIAYSDSPVLLLRVHSWVPCGSPCGLTIAKLSQAHLCRRQLSLNWTHRGCRWHNDQAKPHVCPSAFQNQ